MGRTLGSPVLEWRGGCGLQVAARHAQRTAQIVQERLENAVEIGHDVAYSKRGARGAGAAQDPEPASEIPHSFILVSSVL